MNLLDTAYINRLSPYKVWTENGRDYLIETNRDTLFTIGFIDFTSLLKNMKNKINCLLT